MVDWLCHDRGLVLGPINITTNMDRGTRPHLSDYGRTDTTLCKHQHIVT
jgi:hypothetical protein